MELVIVWLLGGACVWCSRAIVGGSEACHVAGVHLMWREHHCFWRVHYLRLLATILYQVTKKTL